MRLIRGIRLVKPSKVANSMNSFSLSAAKCVEELVLSRLASMLGEIGSLILVSLFLSRLIIFCSSFTSIRKRLRWY
ncbi:hypothetical protein Pst134EB_006301 [Puccinia striiformis f. sp. tritici]|nr:hypothetical protein Pst134EB_006301 [Puccinia striiformis f. sp. tritici]